MTSSNCAIRARFSPIEASNEMSSKSEPILLERAHITTNATCPPDANIHVNSSKASFCKIAHRLFSQEPQASP